MTPLKSIRPTEMTVAGIAAAFQRLAAARAENDAEIARLSEQRKVTLIEGTAAEIDKAEAEARKRRIYIEQLDLLEADLRRQYAIALEAEEDAEFETESDALQEQIEAWNADMQAQYPKLAGEIATLLARETEIVERADRLQRLKAASRKMGHTFGTRDALALMLKATPPDALYARSFYITVRLPGIATPSNVWPPDGPVRSYPQ